MYKKSNKKIKPKKDVPYRLLYRKCENRPQGLEIDKNEQARVKVEIRTCLNHVIWMIYL